MADSQEIVDIIANAEPDTPYADADEGDKVAGFCAHTVGGRYASTGEFLLTISIPTSTFNPHDLMASAGFMLYWEARKC